MRLSRETFAVPFRINTCLHISPHNWQLYKGGKLHVSYSASCELYPFNGHCMNFKNLLTPPHTDRWKAWLTHTHMTGSISCPIQYTDSVTVADPGFPGGRTSEFGRKPIIWQSFYWKVHENERNGTERWGRASLAPPSSVKSANCTGFALNLGFHTKN